MDEVKFHFTHARTRETFLNSALWCLFGFGVLALVFAYVDPLNYVFAGMAVGGFALFTLVELTGGVTGFLYEKENGVMRAARGVGMFVGGLGALVVGFVYLGIGGVLTAGAIMGVLVSVSPQALTPLIIVGYVVFSIAWAANGLSWVEGRSDVSPPPIGLLRQFARLVRISK